MNFLYFVSVVVIICYFYYLYSSNRPEKKIERFEKFTDTLLHGLEVTSKAMYGKEELDEEILLMKDWYVRLKEKYKHDKEKLVEIAEDWKDYVFHESQRSSGTYLWLESDNKEEQKWRKEEIREHIFNSEEIENRFAHLLGEEYEKKLKDLRKKLKKEAEK